MTLKTDAKGATKQVLIFSNRPGWFALILPARHQLMTHYDGRLRTRFPLSKALNASVHPANMVLTSHPTYKLWTKCDFHGLQRVWMGGCIHGSGQRLKPCVILHGPQPPASKQYWSELC